MWVNCSATLPAEKNSYIEINFSFINFQEIQKEIKNEELKLEKIMLERAEAALKQEDKRRVLVKKEMEKHSEELRKQLQEKELIRLKEAERIEEESKKLHQAVTMIKIDEKEKSRQRFEHKKKIQSDLQKAKELSSYFKQLEFEEERRAELKMAEYMRQKREREAQLLVEARIAKEAKDRDHERLLQIQQKILDSKSHREVIRTRLWVVENMSLGSAFEWMNVWCKERMAVWIFPWMNISFNIRLVEWTLGRMNVE